MAAATDRNNRVSDERRAKAKADAVSCEEHREKLLDEALEETFPASDPPSIALPQSGRC